MNSTNGHEPITRLGRDLRAAAATLGRDEARYLVDMYYALQDFRIQATHQVRTLSEGEEPHATLGFLRDQTETLEAQVKSALDKWTDAQDLGVWAKGVVGIGPVIAAGLLAHIDIEKAPTVGHIWRFAGLDPTVRWEKKTKRPWNASLKLLAWKAGESFVKNQNRTDGDGEFTCFYGRVFVDRKEREIARNEAGEFADQAAQALERKRFGKDTKARQFYEQGKLPPAHVHARARRYAVKLFLAHYWEHGYRLVHGVEPPLPYPVVHLGHAHVISAP